MTKKIDGMEWNVADVAAYKTEEAFVKAMLADADIYPRKHPHEKEASLKLTYAACVPAPKAAEAETETPAKTGKKV